jgi:2-keto-3-deoxy-L-rhamnonate aldolase RhmA
MDYTKREPFVQEMRAGCRQVGIRSQLCSTIVAEALGSCGADYVYLDMEHSPNDLMAVLQQAQALAGTPAHTLVRLPTLDPVLIQQLLDFGIENIVVPMIETVEQAKAAVEATRYPPRGIRSMARVHRGNAYGDNADYPAQIESRLCLIAMVETRAALERAHEIAAVDGVHGVLIGPADLSADFGHFAAGLHPQVAEDIANAIPRISQAGAFAGMSTGSPDAAKEWFEKGCQFVSVAGDLQLLVEQARAFTRKVRS